MPFFIKGKKKRDYKSVKNNNASTKLIKSKKKTDIKAGDEEVSSDSDEDVRVSKDYHPSSEEEVEETVQEKRLRLANKYLEEIEQEEKKRLDTGEVDRDVIAARLKEDSLEQAGKLRKIIANNLVGHEDPQILKCKEHGRTITCVISSSDNQYLFSASDDFNIVKWSLSERKKVQIIKRTHEQGHKKRINALAISRDQKFLVSGDAEAKIKVWHALDLSYVHTFSGHKIDVMGLAFRRDSHQLFSCSSDKTVKIWSLDEMMYVETLYGHQCGVASVDVLGRERPVTVGSRDNTLRIWKVPDGTHLVLNGHKESIDCVRLLDEDHMVSGGEDGSVCLWSSLKKKPVHSLPKAHGPNAWVISIAACPFTDVFASGSHTGTIQIYKVLPGMKSFERLFEVPVEGNVNSLCFTSDGLTLVAAVSREHRLGRWTTVPNVKNSILIIKFLKSELK